MSPHRAIGSHGTLPWHIPEDLAHFKQLTWGHTVLMGRKTYESLPHGALPGRRNIVLSQTLTKLPDGEVCRSLKEALALVSNDEEVFVMGGASVYREALPWALRIFITLVDEEPEAADTFFPAFDESQWLETKHEQHPGFAFTDAKLPESASRIDWDKLLDFGTRQSIRGVLLYGIKKLPADGPHPTFPQLKRWLKTSIAIKTTNIQVYRDAVTLSQCFHKETGGESVVMKGQANALRYPDPYIREPGDIDLWTTATTKQLIRWAHSHDPKGSVEYHHVDLNTLATPVELHYVPSFMGNLFYEWRMRQWFKKEKPRQFGNKAVLPDGLGEIGILEPSFDCIFLYFPIVTHDAPLLLRGHRLPAGDRLLLPAQRHAERRRIHHANGQKAQHAQVYSYRDVCPPGSLRLAGGQTAVRSRQPVQLPRLVPVEPIQVGDPAQSAFCQGVSRRGRLWTADRALLACGLQVLAVFLGRLSSVFDRQLPVDNVVEAYDGL